MAGRSGPGMLTGIRVLEIGDETAEYAGLLLAGLGAEVVKLEPPEGSASRRIGPFFEDRPGPERSLHFWAYNRNKKSVVLDLGEAEGCKHLLRLLAGADVLLDASAGGVNAALGLDREALGARFPRSEEHTSELQSHSDLHSFPTRRSSDLSVAAACRRRCAARRQRRRGQRGAGPRSRSAGRAVSAAGHRPADAVWRRWTLGLFQRLGPRPSRPGWRDDELRL